MGNHVSNFFETVQEVVETATNFAVAVDNLVQDVAKYVPIEYSLVRVHSKPKSCIHSADGDDSKLVQVKHTSTHTHALLSDGDKDAYYAKLVQAVQEKFHTLWFEKYHYHYDVNPQITRNGTTFMGTGNDVTVYLNPVSAAIAGVPTPAILVSQILGQTDTWAPNCELKEFASANTNYFTNLLSAPGINFGGTSATAPWKDATGEPSRTAHIDWAVLTASTDYQLPNQPNISTLSIACVGVVQWPWVP